jgi:hypothetical protein
MPRGAVVQLFLFLTSALDGVGSQRHATGRFTLGKDPVTIPQKAGWALGPVWTDAENLAPTRIRSPDRPARSTVVPYIKHVEGGQTWLPYYELILCTRYAERIKILNVCLYSPFLWRRDIPVSHFITTI